MTGVPPPTTEAARAAAVLDWTALEREPHRGALERARHRLAVRRREIAPRLPARAKDGELLAAGTLVARWSLADGATLTLAANLASSTFHSPPALHGRRLLATAASLDKAWPAWYVEWRLDS